LDYTDISLDRFDEFRRLLQKSDKGTIVRITLRMDILNNPYQRQKAYENNEEQFEKDLSDFTEEFTRKHSEFLPSDFSSDKLRPGELPLLIQEMVQISAEKALPASCGLIFQPINSTYYSDGTPMISITGIVADLGEVPEIKKCFKGWNGGNFDWNSPEEINVPILSIKERLLLEKHLPVKTNTGICLSNALGYKIEKSESRNIETLRQYANFNRYYPYFTKVSI
jgi:hypothetical protein